MIKSRKELIHEYIEFFKSHGHKEIPNVSLIPENDPTVLFTTAGMHPLVPFILGQKHAQGKRLVNVQKCIRTGDIDLVGDEQHLTFFEMLGNWSLGDYWKKEAIEFSLEFLKKLGIKKEELRITCFKGDKEVPKDTEASSAWKNLGITDKQIDFLGRDDNWWGPAGKTGPCGPDTEMFVKQNGKWLEIWNDVLIGYNKDKALILVDGMHCLYDKEFNVNKELLEIINNFNTHNILVVDGFREKGFKLVRNYNPTKDTNWEAFSLEEDGIRKANPEYFKVLLKRFNLSPEEVIYFDHLKDNVNSAKKLGIKSELYTDNKKAKKFIEKNLNVYIPLKQKTIDTGMGVERTIAFLQGKEIFETEVFKPIINKIEEISNLEFENKKKEMRVIADHIKAAVFILNEKIVPANIERGYVLRRLIRRTVRYANLISIHENFTNQIAEQVFKIYSDYKFDKEFILAELEKEENKFRQTLAKGVNLFEKIAQGKKKITGEESFLLYQSYGFPIELTQELTKERGIHLSIEEFQKEFDKHQELSRTASAGRFKSGLADTKERTIRLHTAAHLFLTALRKVLNKEIIQKGSNITEKRLRFDFSFDRKLTDEEVKKVEEFVNKAINEKIPVIREEMSLEKARKSRATGIFEDKYGEKVSVYNIGSFSKEICAGPHVKNTSELGEIGKFKIKAQENIGAGTRRIKAVLE